MHDDFVRPEDIDKNLNWPIGTTARLCRKLRLPHYVMPDRVIRLRWLEIQPLIVRVEPPPIAESRSWECHGN